MLMLNALQSYYEFSGDKRVLPHDALLPLGAGLAGQTSSCAGSWQKQRFGRQPGERLLALQPHRRGLALGPGPEDPQAHGRLDTGGRHLHGVNFSQCFREPAVYYQQAEDRKYLEAAERNYQR